MIVSHSTLAKNGRLGNQLFQIASTFGLAEKYNAQVAFPDWEYQNYFEPELPHGPMSNNTVQERFFHHHDWEISGDTDVMGFLQTEKYFGSTRLKLKKDFVDSIKEQYPGLYDRETICIQVRRGDYVGNQNYYQLSPNFFISALVANFPNWMDYNLLVISDDIEYCKVHWGCLPNVYFGTKVPIQDMALASACDHFIISNSSFGWWCAWLGEKKHSKVIHCGKMFTGRLSKKSSEDYYPERWTAFKGDYKIPLRDMTFTIPVYMDHPSRKENVDLICYMLLLNFDTNIMICEQGGSHFRYVEGWAKYLQFKGGVFHRTKMLNEMCNAVSTPYLANLDCDVILPPMQVVYAMELLRAGADVVYPYDGQFARLPRMPWYGELQKTFDIGIVRDGQFKGRVADHNSVGGVVFFNKESFIDGGMENEYFISFGPEDVERYNRFRKLQYIVKRTGGALFHLNHHVGNNSSPKNTYFQQNVLEEQKVTAMTREQLHEYINTWSWRHQYTSRYYTDISEGAIRSAKIVMEALPFQPKSVLDVGCGVGEWKNGHPDYTGIDYGIDKSKLLMVPELFIECNLNRGFPEIHRKFDLVLCLEVAEHLHPSRAEPLVEFLCSMGDKVLFSAAIPHQGGNGHVNEQWQSYWADLFYTNGFGTTANSMRLAQRIVYNEEIEFWYRQNIVLYERGGTGRVTNFVLPAYYEQIVKGLKHG